MGRMDEKLNKKRQAIEDKEAELDGASKKVSTVVLGILSIFKKEPSKSKKRKSKTKNETVKKEAVEMTKEVKFLHLSNIYKSQFSKKHLKAKFIYKLMKNY